MVTKKDLSYLRKLHIPSFAKEEGLFIAETEHLVIEAKQAGLLVKIYATEAFPNAEIITYEQMGKITKTQSPPKVIGLCKMPQSQETGNKILILEEVKDPSNLGSLLRSAKAFGFDTIFLGEGSCFCFNDKVVRASQGAIFKLNIISGNVISFLKKIASEYQILVTDCRNGKSLKEVTKKTKIALVLGNEAKGVSPEALALASDIITIPITEMESLNVGVAGAIIMYELFDFK